VTEYWDLYVWSETFLYWGVYKVAELFCDDPMKEASLPQKNFELGSKTPTYDSVVTD
jgi:hypothetical protein